MNLAMNKAWMIAQKILRNFSREAFLIEETSGDAHVFTSYLLKEKRNVPKFLAIHLQLFRSLYLQMQNRCIEKFYLFNYCCTTLGLRKFPSIRYVK